MERASTLPPAHPPANPSVPSSRGGSAGLAGGAPGKRAASWAESGERRTHGQQPWGGPPRAREGVETMPSRRGSPGRPPPPAGHPLLLPGRRAEAERLRERWPHRPRAPSPLPTSACTPPDESRGRRPTSSSGVPPEPEPVPVLVLCSSSGFRLLMVRGVEWGRREEGNAEGERGAGPGEEAGGGAVSGALRGCRAGWRWGARGGERGGRRVGMGSHQVWRVREAGRGCGGGGTGNRSRAGAATASAFSLRPPSAPAAAAAAAGGGRRGRGRAPGGGGGRGPEPASAGAGPAPRPPRGLRGNAQPIPAAHCGLAPARAAARWPPAGLFSAAAGLSPSLVFPLSFLRDKFLNFDELAQRTFLKGPRATRRPSPRAVEPGAGRPFVPRHPRPAAPRGEPPPQGSGVVGFRS